MLHDSHLGIDREVDVVIEGSFDGDPVVTSFEIIEHGRPASVTWVEQIVAKHRYLPTNRLILISKLGALTAVEAQGGWVEALRPEFIELDDQEFVQTLYANRMIHKATVFNFQVGNPNHGSVLAQCHFDTTIFDVVGRELGTAIELTAELFDKQWLKDKLLHGAHNHPDRDALTSFTCSVPLYELNYYLQDVEKVEFHRILSMEMAGDFTFLQTELSFIPNVLGNRMFAAGAGAIFGQPGGVWVRTINPNTNEVKVSLRVPLAAIPNQIQIDTVNLKFPGLIDLVVSDQPSNT